MSAVIQGICLLAIGIVVMVFHRWLAYRTVASFQKSPEMKEKIYTWLALLGGVLSSAIGIAMLFADHPTGLLFVLVGLYLIAFDKRWARQTVACQRSEEYQRFVTFLVGAGFFLGGLMTLLTRR